VPTSFNSRAHAGRDTPLIYHSITNCRFNSRAHAGRDAASAPRMPMARFQFTRPRGARRRADAKGNVPAGVSIHAPTRGATSAIHATPEVAQFQFTRPRGARRRRRAPAADRRAGVSIHAPTRGATTLAPCRRWLTSFNSRAHAGRDRKKLLTLVNCSPFQFTRPRGARRPRPSSSPLRRSFNSRAHAGRDIARGLLLAQPRVSIHAPTRGATLVISRARYEVAFQFTRPRGARLDAGLQSGRWTVSIHAPTRGATTTRLRCPRSPRFQFTRPRGARHLQRQAAQRAAIVSIHAPTRGATPNPPAGQKARTGFNSRAHAGRDLRTRIASGRWGRFNSRAHAGRDTRMAPAAPKAPTVSIHAPTRGATHVPGLHPGEVVTFQFTRPRGARRRLAPHLSTPGCFNSRAHAGRDRSHVLRTTDDGSFNSRAHAGRDAARSGAKSRRCVSIHAPTRGATTATRCSRSSPSFNSRAHAGRDSSCAAQPAVHSVSIHAPTRGATPRNHCSAFNKRFNSRAHAGRDLRQIDGVAGLIDKRFNSRAHAGRDLRRLAAPPFPRRFNSRAHAGRDLPCAIEHLKRAVSIHAPTRGATILSLPGRSLSPFQFTRPRGARRGAWRTLSTTFCFNSRAHAGRDGCAPGAAHAVDVSIHAPTRGATHQAVWHLARAGVSIHAPTRGATTPSPSIPSPVPVSIHAPTRGATGVQIRGHRRTRVSIHAPTRGATCYRSPSGKGRTCFNSRAHAGRDRA